MVPLAVQMYDTALDDGDQTPSRVGNDRPPALRNWKVNQPRQWPSNQYATRTEAVKTAPLDVPIVQWRILLN
jgi:hypothetical protein